MEGLQKQLNNQCRLVDKIQVKISVIVFLFYIRYSNKMLKGDLDSILSENKEIQKKLKVKQQANKESKEKAFRRHYRSEWDIDFFWS